MSGEKEICLHDTSEYPRQFHMTACEEKARHISCQDTTENSPETLCAVFIPHVCSDEPKPEKLQ